uniref:Alpha-1,3-mannosyl-glycoprotein 2-beta-N-acetylglucosaminyltransferase n=1 Tax=Ascaris lumbricoides TaxID=6252 RepID=A0A0M3HVZ0_ASCLU
MLADLWQYENPEFSFGFMGGILRKRLSEANEISVEMVENLLVPSAENSYIVVYRTPREYRRIARAVGLMIDIRSAVYEDDRLMESISHVSSYEAPFILVHTLMISCGMLADLWQYENPEFSFGFTGGILRKRLSEANEISVEMVENLLVPSAENSYIVVYRTPREYRRIARAVGLMIDIRSGMPRTAYYGVVTFLLGVSRIYAIPAALNENLDFISQPSSAFYNTDWDKMTRYLDFQETYCRPGKFTGACDPNNPELKEWFKKKRLTKRLQSWGEMIVN